MLHYPPWRSGLAMRREHPLPVVVDRELARVRTLARVLDDYLVDPLIGMFLPGIGDLSAR